MVCFYAPPPFKKDPSQSFSLSTPRTSTTAKRKKKKKKKKVKKKKYLSLFIVCCCFVYSQPTKTPPHSFFY